MSASTRSAFAFAASSDIGDGERRLDLGDAVLVMRDDARKPAGEIRIAQEPDQTIEHQVLHGGIDFELQLAGDFRIELVDRAIELGHAVAVAHRDEGRDDRVRLRAGLVRHPHDQRRPAAIDDRIDDMGGDDFAPQAMPLDRFGEPLHQQFREIAAEFAPEIRIVRHFGFEQVAVQRELGIGEQHREFRPRQRLRAAAALGERRVVGQKLPRRD